MNFGQTNWCCLPTTLPPFTSRRQPHGPAADYTPFDGIVLTDTFNLRTDRTPFPKEWMPANSKRVERQQRHGIQVIVGNPPWSVGQKSVADDNPNVAYPDLEQRISETYASRYRLGTRKMRYVDDDKSILAINDVTQLRGIPPEAHGYEVNGRTPLDWLIDRYRIVQDKQSRIVNDLTAWFDAPEELLPLSNVSSM